MIDTSSGIDYAILTGVIEAHVKQYAISTHGKEKADEIMSGEVLAGMIEGLTWNNTTEFTGARSTIASLMFADGFALALRLVEAVTKSPFEPSVAAIGAAFKDARNGIDYTLQSVRHSDELDAAAKEHREDE